MQKYIVEGGIKAEQPATVVLGVIKSGSLNMVVYQHAAGDTTTVHYTSPQLMFDTEIAANERRDAMNAKLGI